MRTLIRENVIPAIALLSLLLMGMDNAPREGNDRRQLEETQKRLATRIEELKKEQDFLLFQRSFTGSDSKYLILDLSAGKGMLKYRNRVLRTFGFTLPPLKHGRIRKGRHVLAGKTDGAPGKRALLVQDLFVIRGKAYSSRIPGDKRLPAIIISKKDLGAIFFSVEKGTMLYIR